MTSNIYIDTPPEFSFRATVYSHGWCELAPFSLDVERWRLSYVLAGAEGRPVAITLSEGPGTIVIEVEEEHFNAGQVVRVVQHLLRIDEPLNEFYAVLAGHERLVWVAERRAGRLLRSVTVFEDLVKTLCTTNCSWALTKLMVSRLVDSLGMRSETGRAAFPTPAAMASEGEAFYRSEVRAGYRSPYFAELAAKVASGKLDPESWLTSDLPTTELRKQIKTVKGVGDYAADNLLKLLGRYDGLALDSWLRSQFYKTYNHEKPCPDKKIERHYKNFGKWRGLAIWCDMTEKWFQ